MEKGLHVTWLPSYGAEVRGGTAHSMIKIESDLIGNPRVKDADTAIIMNGPSLEKFEKKVNHKIRQNGVNPVISSLPDKTKCYYFPLFIKKC